MSLIAYRIRSSSFLGHIILQGCICRGSRAYLPAVLEMADPTWSPKIVVGGRPWCFDLFSRTVLSIWLYRPTTCNVFDGHGLYLMDACITKLFYVSLRTGKPSRYYVTSYSGQLSLAIPSYVGAMNTSESWGVNRHTARYTSPVVSQCKLVSGWGLRKWRSAPPRGLWLVKDFTLSKLQHME